MGTHVQNFIEQKAFKYKQTSSIQKVHLNQEYKLYIIRIESVNVTDVYSLAHIYSSNWQA